MPVDRLLPSDDAVELIALTRDIADKVLDPIVDAHERTETYPDGVFAQLGAAGLLSLPQPEEWGGGGQPFEAYLQVLEEVAGRSAPASRKSGGCRVWCRATRLVPTACPTRRPVPTPPHCGVPTPTADGYV